MDKTNANSLEAIWSWNYVGLDTTGDSEVEEDDNTTAPRKDFGPIGSKEPQKATKFCDCCWSVKEDGGVGGTGCVWCPREEPATTRNEGLMESWASDFIKPGGGLRDGGIDLRGLVPTLSGARLPSSNRRLLPPSVTNFIAPSPDKEIEDDAASVGSSADSGYGSINSSPEAGVYVHPCAYSQAEKVAKLKAILSMSSAASYNPAAGASRVVPLCPQAGRRRCSNDADLKDFAEQFGLIGKLRPGMMIRPRKGKYFKEFAK